VKNPRSIHRAILYPGRACASHADFGASPKSFRNNLEKRWRGALAGARGARPPRVCSDTFE
jgi:hypothetical protein